MESVKKTGPYSQLLASGGILYCSVYCPLLLGADLQGYTLARTKCRTIGQLSRRLIMTMKGKDCTMVGLKHAVKVSTQRRWDMCVGDESRLPFPATR